MSQPEFEVKIVQSRQKLIEINQCVENIASPILGFSGSHEDSPGVILTKPDLRKYGSVTEYKMIVYSYLILVKINEARVRN